MRGVLGSTSGKVCICRSRLLGDSRRLAGQFRRRVQFERLTQVHQNLAQPAELTLAEMGDLAGQEITRLPDHHLVFRMAGRTKAELHAAAVSRSNLPGDKLSLNQGVDQLGRRRQPEAEE